MSFRLLRGNMTAIVLFLLIPSATLGQVGETAVQGKVVSLETTRRAKVLTAEVDGKVQTFTINARVDFRVLASGDGGFLAPRQIVQTMAVASNNRLFTKELVVTVNPVGRLPTAAAVKAPPKPGQSRNAFFVSGPIVSRETTESGYELLQLAGRGKAMLALYVEKGAKIRVNLADPALVEPGQSVTLTGRMVGKRFNLTAVAIDTGKTLKSAEILNQEKF